MLVTYDAEASSFWLTRDYFPEIRTLDLEIMPSLDALGGEIGAFEATPILIPYDCSDGLLGAYWRRPEIYLDQNARRSISAFAKIGAREGLAKLARDLKVGLWRKRNLDLLNLDALDVGYRLLRWEFEAR